MKDEALYMISREDVLAVFTSWCKDNKAEWLADITDAEMAESCTNGFLELLNHHILSKKS